MKPHYHKDSEELLLSKDSFRSVALYTLMAYLFNPYSITACVGQSTAVFENMMISAMIILTVKGTVIPAHIYISYTGTQDSVISSLLVCSVGWRVLATFFLALSAYQSFYSIMLIVPVACCLVQVTYSLLVFIPPHSLTKQCDLWPSFSFCHGDIVSS